VKHSKLHAFTHELRIFENGTQYETVQVRAAFQADLWYKWQGGTLCGKPTFPIDV
jgi:hypothetical protein